MAKAKSGFLHKVLDRLGRLDADGVQKVVQELARERTFLETLFDTIEDGVLVVDGQGQVVFFNQAVTRLVGLAPESAAGQTVQRLLPEVDWEKLSGLEREGERRVIRQEFEVSYPRPRSLRLFASPLGEGSPGGAGVVLILHDVTEMRQQTAEAIESERVQALTLLAASVAHEIGNPLNALHIHLQLMERELRRLRSAPAVPVVPPGRVPRQAGRSRRAVRVEGDEARAGVTVIGPELAEVGERLERYLGVAKGEIARLDYIVTQFLQAIRPARPQIRPSALNDVVNETLALLGPELENRGLLTDLRLARGLPDAPFDGVQIQQALVNLVKNSMQAMTRGGVLTLETGRLSDGVWVSVGDTGTGIPQDRLGRLFEPFFTTKKKGTGLGLMIVYRIVRDHGGRIDVESNPGRGTVFRLWLPLRERHPRLLEAGAGEEKRAKAGV